MVHGAFTLESNHFISPDPFLTAFSDKTFDWVSPEGENRTELYVKQGYQRH
jgi:hypothetical protein